MIKKTNWGRSTHRATITGGNYTKASWTHTANYHSSRCA